MLLPHGCVLLAYAEGKLAGYVQPDWRGHHLGRMLAEFLIDEAKAAGYKNMRLDTLSTMKAAQALYLSLGFQPIAPYHDNPLEAVVYLELKLAGN